METETHLESQTEVRFKGSDSDSRSFEIKDMLRDKKDLALGWLFDMSIQELESDVKCDIWGGDKYYLLHWLDPNEQEDLFKKDESNQMELKELIKKKKKNNS